MNKLKREIEEVLAVTHPSVVDAAQCVTFDRKTTAHVWVAGVRWFMLLKAIDEKDRTPAERDAFNNLPIEKMAGFILDRIREQGKVLQ